MDGNDKVHTQSSSQASNVRMTSFMVNRETQEALIDLLCIPDANKFVANDPERAAKFNLYKQKVLWMNDSNCWRLLSIKKLESIVKLLDISFRELFAEIGIEIEWPNERAGKIASLAEGFDKVLLSRLDGLCTKLMPELWTVDGWKRLKYGYKLKRYVRYLYNTDERIAFAKQMPSELALIYKDVVTEQEWRLVTISEIIPYARILGFSLKWFLGVDADTPIMCRDIDVDNFMSKFLMLGQRGKDLVESVVLLSQKEGSAL